MTAPAKLAVFERQAAMFGVCEALGEDFGISANWFRLALVPLVIVEPLWTLIGYFLVGMLVMATRLLFPDVQASELSPANVIDEEPGMEELRLAA